MPSERKSRKKAKKLLLVRAEWKVLKEQLIRYIRESENLTGEDFEFRINFRESGDV